ncbi:MAG: hypothetical protein WC645_08705, partial [Candidatus Margulisiibacteriota bacterium]
MGKSERDKLIDSLRMDAFIRWVVILIGLILVLVFYAHGKVSQLWPIWLVGIFLFTYNLIYSLLLKCRIVHPLMNYLDTFFDVLAITVVAYFTGGSASIFYWFYLFSIIAEGFHFHYRGIYFILVASFLCFGTLLFIEAGETVSWNFVLLALERLGLIFLMGIVTLFYTRKAIEREKQLEESRAQLAVSAVNNIRAYEAEKKAVAEMKELDKLKDEFISMV